MYDEIVTKEEECTICFCNRYWLSSEYVAIWMYLMRVLFIRIVPVFDHWGNCLSIRLGGPAHGIMTKTVHKTLSRGGGGPGGE